jgi:nitrogen fixation/metabolism regulation signal transduction histidine kinase
METVQDNTADLADERRDKRAVNRLLRFALIAAVALSLVLLVLLATATSNTEYFQRAYQWLFWLTVAVTVGLFALIVELLRRLIQRYKRGLFGTRLMARMALSFSLMTLLPVLLIYLVAVAFVGRSIESWFDVPLETALESGLTMGRATLDNMRTDATAKANAMANVLAETSRSSRPAKLIDLSSQNVVRDAALVTGNGQIVSSSGNQFAPLVPDLPSGEQLSRVRLTREYAEFESPQSQNEETNLQLRVIVPVDSLSANPAKVQYLQLIEQVPAALAASAEAIEAGRAGYQQLLESRGGLKRLFRVTLTLIFLLTAFAAIAAAFLLSGWLTGPLSMLAAGTRAVAEGDFRPVKDYSRRSELGVLTQSFNAMTRQLEDARSLVDRNQKELEQVNARLESVLSNLTAGVIVLDSDFRISLVNQGAERMLGISTFEHVDQAISDVAPLASIAGQIRQAFSEQAQAGEASWQRQFTLGQPEIMIGEGEQKGARLQAGQTIAARGSILPEQRIGYVIVFDEITELVSAQRANTWAEVARRLAHEFKNPLTPIQLSAERMQFKLAPKLDEKDAAMLERSSTTIVNQVGALKVMLDEFREYARLPAAHLEPLDLNGLIEDVLGLYQTSGPGVIPLAGLGENLPSVMGDQTQLRQLVHNLIKNALEAVEDHPDPLLEIETAQITTGGGQSAVRLTVRDNGPGFPAKLLGRLFEPYVSSKLKGTGLGLAIVKKIADEHGARIEAINLAAEADSGDPGDSDFDRGDAVKGAQVEIVFSKLAKSVDNTVQHA